MDLEKTDKNQTTILWFQCITSHMADITSPMTDICRKHPRFPMKSQREKGTYGFRDLCSLDLQCIQIRSLCVPKIIRPLLTHP